MSFARDASPIDRVLVRLTGVQRAGKGYRAHCPNCGGKSQKLAVVESDEGSVLMNCFGCYDTPAILAAVGLTLADLYPTAIRDDTPQGRQAARQAFKQSARDTALRVVARESQVILIASEYPRRGQVLSNEDHDRLTLAVERTVAAMELLQ